MSYPYNLSIMEADWRIGEAKQRFSEVVRRSSSEPQRIYNRDRLVAAVVSAELLDEIEQLRRERSTWTLDKAFSEIRDICDEEGYQLDVGKRRDRESWLGDDS